MLRVFLYVLILGAIVVAGALAIDYLLNETGGITVDWGDRRWEFSLFWSAMLLIGVVIAFMAAVVVLKFAIALVRFCLFDETAFDSFWGKRRERKGLEALANSLLAMESGDAKKAKKLAEAAERKLGRPALTRLINAKAATMAGDTDRARTYYAALMSEDSTAFVGAHGLLEQAIAEDNTERALKLANKAHTLQPKDSGTLETLYELQSQAFDWDSARTTVKAQRKAGYLPKLETDRRESSLALAQSQDAEEAGEADKARDLAVEAAKTDPSNTNAVATAVRHLVDADAKRAASKLVQDAWRQGPATQLAAAYASIEPDEAPAARRRRFEGLFSLHPQHPETKFLRAELALVAEDWKGARDSIEDLRETEPSARSCAIMAAIARGENEPDHVIRGWLARALGAPRKGDSDSEISHAAMLPLLIEPSSDTTVADAETVEDPNSPDLERSSAADDTAEPSPDQPTDSATAAQTADNPVDTAKSEEEPKPQAVG